MDAIRKYKGFPTKLSQVNTVNTGRNIELFSFHPLQHQLHQQNHVFGSQVAVEYAGWWVRYSDIQIHWFLDADKNMILGMNLFDFKLLSGTTIVKKVTSVNSNHCSSISM